MSIETLNLDQLAFEDLVRTNQKIVITSHVNPDGDAIGSEVGLGEWLRSLGKDVRIVNHSPTPHNYEFIARGELMVEQFDAEEHDTLIKETDLLWILDVNDPDRVKSVGEYVSTLNGKVAVIDHHLEPKDFATNYFIDTEACSTGELIYRLITPAMSTLGGTITERGAQALYVAIMTDTGGFKFPRTDSGVFRMCADLLDCGADPVIAYDEVFNSSPATRLLLMRECLNSLQYFHDNRMAVQLISQAQLKSLGATPEEVDGFVQMPFQVKGVVLSVFILELPEGWKLSARSKGDVSAAKLAQSFGGNGHFNAAGARFFETIDDMEILSRVSAKGLELLNEAGVTA